MSPFNQKACFRYALDINLTDEQLYHPLVREAEGIACGMSLFNQRSKSLKGQDHIGLVNDLFSYGKECMTGADDTNVLRILQDLDGMTFKEAKITVEQKIKDKEQEFIRAGLEALQDPVLGSNPEVYRWIACLPYCMGGHIAWCHEVIAFISIHICS